MNESSVKKYRRITFSPDKELKINSPFIQIKKFCVRALSVVVDKKCEITVKKSITNFIVLQSTPDAVFQNSHGDDETRVCVCVRRSDVAG